MNQSQSTNISNVILENFNWTEFIVCAPKAAKFNNGDITYGEDFKDFVVSMTNLIISGTYPTIAENDFYIAKYKDCISFIYAYGEYFQKVTVNLHNGNIQLKTNPQINTNKNSVLMAHKSKHEDLDTSEIFTSKIFTSKYIYRIRNKKTYKYIFVGAEAKSIWQCAHAVIIALNNIKIQNDIQDLEICLFPINKPITIDTIKFFNMYKEKNDKYIDS